MPTQIDHEESELLQAFEQGQLKSIASVLHKYVTDRLTERPAQRAPSAKSAASKHRV